MDTLLSSPEMEHVAYALDVIRATKFAGILYCVYDKTYVAECKSSNRKNIFPTDYYLKVASFERTLCVTEHMKKNLSMKYDLDIDFKKGLLYKLCFQGNETDTDIIFQKPRPFLPRNSFAKIVSVSVSFDGLDKNGNVVWNVDV